LFLEDRYRLPDVAVPDERQVEEERDEPPQIQEYGSSHEDWPQVAGNAPQVIVDNVRHGNGARNQQSAHAPSWTELADQVDRTKQDKRDRNEPGPTPFGRSTDEAPPEAVRAGWNTRKCLIPGDGSEKEKAPKQAPAEHAGETRDAHQDRDAGQQTGDTGHSAEHRE
jgi:hypothetical protein